MDLKSLLRANILNPGIELRPLGLEPVGAVLGADGRIEIDGRAFADPDQAMHHVLSIHQAETTSQGLQFWGWYDKVRDAWLPLEHARAQWENLGSEQAVAIKTSVTHPLRVDCVAPEGGPGQIGMTFCPGKKGEGLYGGRWERDLMTDLAAIEQSGGELLISLVENHEFALLGVPDFAKTLSQHRLQWLHFPIKDMSRPDERFEALWLEHRSKLLAMLAANQCLVLHCRGGLGRTGMIAARLLVELGEAPASAIRRVRAARERAIETFAQEQYVLHKAWLA